jgi:hypothetical protein
MADMVVNEVAGRVAQAEVRCGRMEGHRVTELFALAPDRIVVVDAVDAEHIEPAGVAAADAKLVRLGNRSADQATQRYRLDPDRLAVFELGDRLSRRVHRYRADWRDAVCKFRPGVDRELVERMAAGPAQLLVANVRRKELAMGWVEDREIKPHLLEPIMHQARDKRGRQIDCILDRQTPPGRLARSTIESLLPRHPGEIAFAQGTEPRGPALNGLCACGIFEVFERDRFELPPMAVRINDLMGQPIMDDLRLGFFI